MADQGVGIDGELQGRLFEPFVRGAASGTDGESSTGLGLAISRALVRAHGGELTLASQTQIGTTATVRLPLQPPVDRRTDPSIEPDGRQPDDQ